MRSKKKSERLFYIICYVVLSLFAVVMIMPFIWMILSTFKPQNELMTFPPKFFPKHFTLDNYKEVLTTVPFFKYYLNSLLVTTVSVILVLFTSSTAGFAFAKYQFKGKNQIFKLLVSAMMIPFPVTIIPLYIMIYTLGLVDSYIALIITGIVSIFGTFLMRQFILGIPNDLLDAARIDGCNEWMVYRKIILPNIKPVLSALAIFSFMGVWNAFLWPLLVVNGDKHRTVQLGVQYFTQQYGDLVHLQITAAAMAVLPIIILYLFLQKQFIKGITMTGLKG
ncbi:carbohydrate ABC transporter permease [Oceanotoga sp. DSM 15011]|jgi:multiple sugar transport system permease protein|uniref:Carbohydrate ABC transporter membrane protein 2 (CUT1 family) n=1 Tax=Oceanotoga teriensis TaxID=515440 RepID=A0AA45C7X0_9BACT|nr:MULTISPECIES: carbohydrate ABC transporter permease [Oceanotoga]MDN5342492.1 multiple sugar transport system permease protein [Oceanotoga sp.]MDO7977508.1 carbohydrate ABC transporter permease [Oceanotoga teriensis]PWJ95624.1 carbohydrate ABC transporter membrane protein 2 (CUT1 family) [Oceanotoga teriensis]UYO99458.1 carbohydrate ABC transporter permease [Oceanotoga sp. DSM 15011]